MTSFNFSHLYKFIRQSGKSSNRVGKESAECDGTSFAGEQRVQTLSDLDIHSNDGNSIGRRVVRRDCDFAMQRRQKWGEFLQYVPVAEKFDPFEATAMHL